MLPQFPFPPQQEPEQPDPASRMPGPNTVVERVRFAPRVSTLFVALAAGFVALACLLDPITITLAALVLAVAVRTRFLHSRHRRNPMVPADRVESALGRPVASRKVRLGAAFACTLLTYALWSHFRSSSDGPLDTGGISSVRVWNSDPLLDERLEPPDATAYNPSTVADLLALIRSAQETRDHKCSSAGVIRLQRPFGRSERLEFLPGHDPEWYEFRHGIKAYRVPREPFVAAMKRVGIDVPLTCP